MRLAMFLRGCALNCVVMPTMAAGLVRERRAVRRHRVSYLVRFSWKKGRGQRVHSKGFTRDLSSGGMYVFSARRPPRRTRVEFTVILPALGEFTPSMEMQGIGRVLRVESGVGEEAMPGFAARCDKFSLMES